MTAAPADISDAATVSSDSDTAIPADALPTADQLASVSDFDQIAARRTVDAAKQLLMNQQGMTEPEAHRWIQKTAMDRRTTKVLIAGSIIAGFTDAHDTQDDQ